MPTYDYKCENCNETFEIFQSIKEEPLTKCPKCGLNTLKKTVSMPAGLIFKGSGFYLTDYKNTKNASAGTNNTHKEKTKTEKDKNTPKESSAKDKKTEPEKKSGNA